VDAVFTDKFGFSSLTIFLVIRDLTYCRMFTDIIYTDDSKFLQESNEFNHKAASQGATSLVMHLL